MHIAMMRIGLNALSTGGVGLCPHCLAPLRMAR